MTKRIHQRVYLMGDGWHLIDGSMDGRTRTHEDICQLCVPRTSPVFVLEFQLVEKMMLSLCYR